MPRWCSSSHAGCATVRPICMAEEDDLAKDARLHLGPRPRQGRFPRLHAEPDAAAGHSSDSYWTIDSTPESPDTPVVRGVGLGPDRPATARGSPTDLTAPDRARILESPSPPTVTARRQSSARHPARSGDSSSRSVAERRRPRRTWRAGSRSPRCTGAARLPERPRSPSSPSPTSPVGAAPTAVPGHGRREGTDHLRRLEV